jgi:predicted MFS family arabinose efflux permease
LSQASSHVRFNPATVMLVMTFVGYTVSFMDRQIVSVLIEPIKTDLGLSDGDLGLLTGFSFALFYCAVSLPIAALADRLSRKRIIVAAMAFWSIMTALFGFARTYPALFLARMAVGGGEAAFAPAAYSMTADYYPRRNRSSATGIIAAGSMVGAMCGLMLGGYVAEHFGWRMAMKLAAIPGIIVAVAYALLVREPNRGQTDSVPAVQAKTQRFGSLARNPAYLLLVGSAIAGMFVLYGCLHWFPTYLIRTHHMTEGAIGLLLGPVMGGVGVASMLAGGYATDAFARVDVRWTAWCPAVAALIGVPLLAFAFHTNDRSTAVTCFALAYFAVMFQCAPIVATIQSLVQPTLRARATAVFMLTTTLAGSGFGPTLLGFVSDFYGPSFGQESLRHALLTMTPMLMASPLLLALAAPLLARGEATSLRAGPWAPADTGS